MVSLLTLAAPGAFAAPLVLDTQSGISDGHSGTVLQTAPLSHERIVQAKQMATPTELTPNSSVPIVVAPYVQLPAGSGSGNGGGGGSGTSGSHTKPQPRLAPSTQ
ncbi:hypothetical protein [Paraburkholderia sp. BCC1885]|uniref:hypothetical protein n=1 Tax=Paraburkholderia sp. BCC1885 TaxID=2562669 RepID=UPI0021B26DCD|nr:hypothetical protein [Paraburkholderia sp. BCC1885]